MKKIVLILFILLLIVTPVYATDEIINSQKEALNISDFLKQSQKYTEDIFPDLDTSNLLDVAIKGEVEDKGFFDKIFNFAVKEIITSIKILGSVLIIIVIHSIIKSIGENLGNTGVSKITYYVQYILIVTLIMYNFTEIVQMVRDSIQNLTEFMNVLVPIMMTLMLTTGNIASASVMQPIILFCVVFISNIVNIIILPIVLVTTVLGIVSNISNKVQINKLGKFLKSGIIWSLGIIITIFVSILSLEGTLTSSVDGLTAKTVKAVASNAIPIIGKALSDATDSVIGCAALLKNALGFIGIIIILGICIIPIIKLAALTIIYNLASALCEPIADESIVKLLGHMGDTFKILLAIICFISVLFIIGTTIAIKVTNTGMMYR